MTTHEVLTPVRCGRKGATTRHASAAVLALLLTVLALFTAPAAWAHSALVSSNPGADAVLESPPAELVLEFNEEVLQAGSQVVVSTESGVVSSGEPRAEGTTLTQALGEQLPAGRYDVQWRVTSEDGHPISGEFSFSSTASSPIPSATPEPSTSTTSSEPPPSSSATSSAPSSSPSPTQAEVSPAPIEDNEASPGLSWGQLSGVLLLAVLVILLAVLLLRRRQDPGHR